MGVVFVAVDYGVAESGVRRGGVEFQAESLGRGQVGEHLEGELFLSLSERVASFLLPFELDLLLVRLTHIGLSLFDQPIRILHHLLEIVAGKPHFIRGVPHPLDVSFNFFNKLFCLLLRIGVVIPQVTLTSKSFGCLKVHSN